MKNLNKIKKNQFFFNLRFFVKYRVIDFTIEKVYFCSIILF